MPPDSIDYSALTQPLTNEDVRAFKNSNPVPLNIGALLFKSVGGIYVCIVIFSLLLNPKSWPTMIATGIIIGLIGLVIFLVARTNTKRKARMYKFALSNNLNYFINHSDPGYAGMIFDEGHSRSITEALVFQDGIEIGNYSYTTGSGKSRTVHFWGYMRVQLSRKLPHMVLDAKSNNLFKRFSNLSDSFGADQAVKLEGDFNNHFTLYVPKQYEQDALYVMTPDVMAAMVDLGAYYDMEIVDDFLFLYAPDGLTLDSEENLRKMRAVVAKISSELRDQSSYYSDARVGDRQANVVALQGSRLKTNIGITTVLGIIVAIAYYAWVIIENSK